MVFVKTSVKPHVIRRIAMIKAILSALSVAAFSISVFAWAQGNDPAKSSDQGLGKQCQSDISRYCKDVTPGQGRIAACLKAHDDKLSSQCSQAWRSASTKFKQGMKQEARAMRQACGSDIQKYCSDAVGPRDTISCLNSHSSNLSNSCKNYQASVQQKMGTQPTG